MEFSLQLEQSVVLAVGSKSELGQVGGINWAISAGDDSTKTKNCFLGSHLPSNFIA